MDFVLRIKQTMLAAKMISYLVILCTVQRERQPVGMKLDRMGCFDHEKQQIRLTKQKIVILVV
jgi:phage gp45-like